jgi:hypothetical protein
VHTASGQAVNVTSQEMDWELKGIEREEYMGASNKETLRKFYNRLV